MSYIAVPYQVMFEDTMAYGTHHYLTNFRFQCIAREQFLFNGLFDRDMFKDVVILTREGYSRNLAPVALGERVAILLTIANPTRSSTQLCFRVVREDGAPVCCGYQGLVFTSKAGDLIPIPTVLTNFVIQNVGLLEDLVDPPFTERVVSGQSLKTIFAADLCELGKRVAGKREGIAIADASWLTSPNSPPATIETSSERVVFLFPGQGSYSYTVLKDLYDHYPETRPEFQQADAIAHQYFNCSFSALAQAPDPAAHNRVLSQSLELDQMGIYVLNVLLAKLLINSGVQPDLLVGQSFGEITALTISGVVDFSTGLEIVCRRVLALADAAEGGMMALRHTSERLPQILEALQGHLLTTAVINHGSQIVLSGDRAALDSIEQALTPQGISCRLLKSRRPFHSPLLADAAQAFQHSLEEIEFAAPQIPIYSPIHKTDLTAGVDFADILAGHLTTALNFQAAVDVITQDRPTVFIECGGGEIVTHIVQKNLDQLGRGLVRTVAIAPPNQTLTTGLQNILHPYNQPAPNQSTATEPLPSPQTVAATNGAAINGTQSRSFAIQTSEKSSDPVPEIPIAIVGMGSVLPGSRNVEEYWQTILSGISGIVDLGDLDPSLIHDFKAEGDQRTPDKTYSLLSGRVPNFSPSPQMPYAAPEFTQLSRGQQFLAQVLLECGLPQPSQRVHCLLGSTADGIAEYDETLIRQRLADLLQSLDEPEALKSAFANGLDHLFPTAPDSPYAVYRAVIDRLLGASAQLMLVDAACASSLYTTKIGLSLLRTHQSDLVLAGGVFAPGTAMNCLFAQFKGLSATGSRPFDVNADGVVFTEGAAMLALKRLPDAVAAGDPIHGVIRAVGTSSDGKSPAVNVPSAVGQALACRRAYQQAQIDPQTVQYIEAHATSTRVGDATEYKSLCMAYGDRTRPAALSSVKSIIGHTGWVSGAASLIKVCQALKTKLIPPQHNYQAPNKDIDLTDGSFAISTQATPWPTNDQAQPRRATVNGFGFGGTNANVIVEAYDADYHASLSKDRQPQPQPLALVGVGTLFPDRQSGIQSVPGDLISCFGASTLHLPVRKRLLPDVTEEMDRSQFLAVMATAEALKNIDDALLTDLKERIGLVLGLSGKTERGVAALDGLYRDRIQRLLTEHRDLFSLSDPDFKRISQMLQQHLAIYSKPSTPYTLTGSMPNVTAGRVTHLFDFKGPNLVVDTGSTSLLDALYTADLMLRDADLDLVLAGAISSVGPTCRNATDCHQDPLHNQAGESACLLALTTLDFATAHHLPIQAIATLMDTPKNAARVAPQSEVGRIAGTQELALALQQMQQTQRPISIQWSDLSSDGPRSASGQRPTGIQFSPPTQPAASVAPASETQTQASPATSRRPESLQQHPIGFYTPHLCPVPLSQSPTEQKPQRILVLVDQPWELPLPAHSYAVVCPADRAVPGAVAVDLQSEATLTAGLQSLSFETYDALIVLKNLHASPSSPTVTATDPLLNLLFAVSRAAYPQLQSGRLSLATICLGITSSLHPYTGLLAGFVKSLSRELPSAICKAISTDAPLALALEQAQLELKSGASVEVCYRNQARHVFKLCPLPTVTTDSRTELNEKSVVVATGGGRGVTAVLMAKLLQRFGCTVILVGRTSCDRIPAEILRMDADRFEQYEGEFYQAQLAQNPSQRMPELKRQYAAFQAARELEQTLHDLQALPGTVDYLSADISDPVAVNQLIQQIVAQHGPIDWVVHGAGVQLSKRLPKRKLTEFQQVLNPKLAGIQYLYQACQQHQCQPHFHLLTSTFSYIGNDGQPDYGAANEYLNRLAAQMDSLGQSRWTALAWLGWAGVGMTRGSEYAVLSAERGLRAITPPEGQFLFTQLLQGTATAPINILLTEGEQTYYQVDVMPSLDVEKSPNFTDDQQPRLRRWILGPQSAPYLLDHLVGGVPTLPATFEQELAVQAALALRPEQCVAAIANTQFTQFVKFFDRNPKELWTEATILSETDQGTVVQVQLRSNFTHKSGVTLSTDNVHCQMEIHLAAQARPIPNCYPRWWAFEGDAIAEPYTHPQSPVKLSGIFDCLKDIVIGPEFRRARLRLPDSDQFPLIAEFTTPAIVVDAMLRLATSSGGDSPTTFVPQGWERLYLKPQLNDVQLRGQALFLIGANSQLTGDTLSCDWLQVIDAEGNVLALMEQAVGLRRSDSIASQPSEAAFLQKTDTLLTDLQQLLVKATRYPVDILTPEADFEEDLGIDSVKLAEVFAVMQERWQLPPIRDLQIPADQLRTLEQLADAIAPHIASDSGSPVKPETIALIPENHSNPVLPSIAVPPATQPMALSSVNGHQAIAVSPMSKLPEIQQILAKTTRYPLDILTPEADFEEDLGIDSVKLAEVFAVVQEQFHLPPMRELDIPVDQLRTVKDLAQAVETFGGDHPGPARDPQPAGAAVPNQANTNRIAAPLSTESPQQNRNGRYTDPPPNLGPSTTATPFTPLAQASATATPNGHHRNGHSSGASLSQSEAISASPRPLQNKIALVTGSGRGLGKVIATQLAQQGATVIVNSFHSRDAGDTTVAEIQAAGGQATHLWGSIASETQLQALFDQIESEFGCLDFLISSASNGLLARLEEITPEHLMKAFQTNVIGLQQGALRAAPLMRKRGGGKIITLSTNAAHRYIPYFSCMATVKAGVEALTRYLAVELADDNIQVNCVSSGPVYGSLIEAWPDSKDLIPYWESISIGNQLCHPEDVADIVAYLLRDEVKRINGSTLLIDAGQTIHL